MYKGLFALIFTVAHVSWVFAEGGLFSFEEKPSAGYSKIFKVEVTHWQTSGSGFFRISFPSPFPIFDNETGLLLNPYEVLFGSTLNYKEMDTGMLLLSGEVRPFHRLGFDFRYGSSDFDGGKGFDHDWIHSPQSIVYSPGHVYTRPEHADFSESESSLDGSTRLLTSSFYFRLFTTSMVDYISIMDLSAGYIHYEDKIRMRNGVQTEALDPFLNFVLGLPPPGTTFSGLDSRYDFKWGGPIFGVRQKHIFTKKFSAEGALNYSPYINYKGEGRWNLRSDFKQNPSFSHNARGYVFDYDVNFAYTPVKLLVFRVGYMYLKFKATNGTDTTYFSNGAVTQVLLEEVFSKRTGFTTSVSLNF